MSIPDKKRKKETHQEMR